MIVDVSRTSVNADAPTQFKDGKELMNRRKALSIAHPKFMIARDIKNSTEFG